MTDNLSKNFSPCLYNKKSGFFSSFFPNEQRQAVSKALADFILNRDYTQLLSTIKVNDRLAFNPYDFFDKLYPNDKPRFLNHLNKNMKSIRVKPFSPTDTKDVLKEKFIDLKDEFYTLYNSFSPDAMTFNLYFILYNMYTKRELCDIYAILYKMFEEVSEKIYIIDPFLIEELYPDIYFKIITNDKLTKQEIDKLENMYVNYRVYNKSINNRNEFAPEKKLSKDNFSNLLDFANANDVDDDETRTIVSALTGIPTRRRRRRSYNGTSVGGSVVSGSKSSASGMTSASKLSDYKSLFSGVSGSTVGSGRSALSLLNKLDDKNTGGLPVSVKDEIVNTLPVGDLLKMSFGGPFKGHKTTNKLPRRVSRSKKRNN